MNVPETMKKFTKGFHQDIFLIESTLEGAIRHALMFISTAEKSEVREFLKEILDGTRDTTQIRQVWDALPKDIRIDSDEEVVEFLKYILGVLSRTT